MNLPNKLTVGRIVLVPFFVAALLIDFPYSTSLQNKADSETGIRRLGINYFSIRFFIHCE